jgi:5-carboxymethyl-2-hydroxymuconate isomerase
MELADPVPHPQPHPYDREVETSRRKADSPTHRLFARDAYRMDGQSDLSLVIVRAFVSYSHDSADHKESVLTFVHSLRTRVGRDWEGPRSACESLCVPCVVAGEAARFDKLLDVNR